MLAPFKIPKESNNLELKHIPVLLNESIIGLNIKPNGIYIDGTLGGAGHSIEIAKRLNKEGKLIGIDRDEKALCIAKKRLSEFQNITYVHNNHDNIKEVLEYYNIQTVDGILLDLGVSSFQIDEAERGFSYNKNSELDMRMDKSQELSAKKVINEYGEKQLADIIFNYGEERFARKIAFNICKFREIKKIETTEELVEIIKRSVPSYKKEEGHPAKRTFQAIRIEVNNELEPLRKTVLDCINALNSTGRLCIITFHSLEDRIVKNAYIEAVGQCKCPTDLPYCVCGAKSLGKIITKKPILPSANEIEQNRRSNSAKLRIFEKI